MQDEALWKTFEKTGSAIDYLTYKGIFPGNDTKAGEERLESENNSDRHYPVSDSYGGI